MNAKVTVIELSPAAKEMFRACKKEILTAAADECAKWGLTALVSGFEAGYVCFYTWDEALAVFKHGGSLILTSGGKREDVAALRASARSFAEIKERWDALEKREADAQRTVNEAASGQLGNGVSALPMTGTDDNIPF